MDRYASALGRDIMKLNNSRRRYMSEHLTDCGLAGPLNAMLMCILNHEGCSQEFLADHLVLDKATAARAARSLEERGYIRREIDGDDRRYYRIYATDSGREKSALIRQHHLDWSAKLVAGLSPKEREIALDLLERMAANLSACEP